MGMFDYVKIRYKLPWPGMQETLWQSKGTPDLYLNTYEIREDGTIWKRADKRWEKVDYDGAIECHTSIEHVYVKKPGHTHYSIQFWFRGGVVKDAIYTKTES